MPRRGAAPFHPGQRHCSRLRRVRFSAGARLNPQGIRIQGISPSPNSPLAGSLFAYSSIRMEEFMRQIRLDEIFKALGDPTRLRLMNLLRMGSICVCDLQVILRMPQPTVSRHLAALRHAGLVLFSRDGPRMVYSLPPATTPQLESLHQMLDRSCPDDEVMRSDLDRLKEAVRLGKCRLEPAGSRCRGMSLNDAILQGNVP